MASLDDEPAAAHDKRGRGILSHLPISSWEIFYSCRARQYAPCARDEKGRRSRRSRPAAGGDGADAPAVVASEHCYLEIHQKRRCYQEGPTWLTTVYEVRERRVRLGRGEELAYSPAAPSPPPSLPRSLYHYSFDSEK
mmetsp:Transcript_33031/g.53636  ORF Transcript_33031/g.53636 Transcript_33031/m.53636 type:complete len:138 (+) Transcript_33031:861-1274(+)